MMHPTEMTPTDRLQMVTRFRRGGKLHLHLDWRLFEAWLDEPNLLCRVIRSGPRIKTLIGATLHGSWAWLRFMLPPLDPDSHAALWQAVAAELRAQGVDEVYCLSMQEWVGRTIQQWGFERVNTVISMRRMEGPIPDEPEAPLRLRPMQLVDLDEVARIDAEAFSGPWRYSPSTLAIAYNHASVATVLEQDEQVIGYQISTHHYNAGHLARLAVSPTCQGQGHGGLLIGAMLRYFFSTRMITVNTQDDNIRSKRLYERLGFRQINDDVPVYRLEL